MRSHQEIIVMIQPTICCEDNPYVCKCVQDTEGQIYVPTGSEQCEVKISVAYTNHLKAIIF